MRCEIIYQYIFLYRTNSIQYVRPIKRLCFLFNAFLVQYPSSLAKKRHNMTNYCLQENLSIWDVRFGFSSQLKRKYNLLQYGIWVSKFHIIRRCYDSFFDFPFDIVKGNTYMDDLVIKCSTTVSTHCHCWWRVCNQRGPPRVVFTSW